VVFNALFAFCHFETKVRVFLFFELVFVLLIGQVNFVLEWPKGEFVSLLAAFC
jgi:hypothetical protein